MLYEYLVKGSNSSSCKGLRGSLSTGVGAIGAEVVRGLGSIGTGVGAMNKSLMNQ